VIAPSFLLTATHAVFDEKLNQLSHETSFTISQTQLNKFLFQVDVSRIIIHPNYCKTLEYPVENKKWDLALLKLNNDINRQKGGWASLKVLDKKQKGIKIHVSGYPAQKTLKSYLSHKKYEHMVCLIWSDLLNSWMISTFIMTLIHQGDRVVEMNGEICCYGIHTDGEIFNRGVKITEETLSFLEYRKRKTLK